jgi:hypothetical protein
MILGGVATQVAEATQAGTVTIEITEDPEFVIAATPPSLPASLSATQVAQNTATVSWTAPTSNGGSPITGYTATASPGGSTCTTAELSCEITGLNSGVTYSYSVLATNAIGSSPVRQATITYVPAPVANPTTPDPVTNPTVPNPVANPAPTAPSSGPSLGSPSSTSTGTTPSGSNSTSRGATTQGSGDNEDSSPETPETAEPEKDETGPIADAPVDEQINAVQTESTSLWWLWIIAAFLAVALVTTLIVRRRSLI